MHSGGLALVLVIRLFDMVGTPPAELAGARQVAADLLAGARIPVVWVSCSRTETARRDARCDDVPLPTDLMVRIASSPAGLTSGALAEAYVDTHAAWGVLTTIYADRTRALAIDSGVEPGTLMGRAMAHEIGHLLFGSSAHSDAGVMRAVWSAASLRRDSPRAWSFSKSDAARLRAAFESRQARLPTSQHALVEWPPAPPCTKGALACAPTQ